jgi:two-component system sensor histidine kinase EvgS
VIEAENGDEAVALADRYKPDAVLMDIRMPVMDGYEAVEKIRNNPRTADIPVVAFTASNIGGIETDARARLFDGHLGKPVTRSDLLRELVRVAPHFYGTESGSLPEQSTPEPAPSVSREKILELLGFLEGSLNDEWIDVARKKTFRDIGAFGAKLVSLGEEFGIRGVCDYGGELAESAEVFDIERMNRLMNEYPSRIRSIRSLLS